MIIQAQVLNKMVANNDTSLLIGNNLDEEYFSDYEEEFNFEMGKIISRLKKISEKE